MCQIFANQDPVNYTPSTRKIRLNGQSTSIRLESLFWDILDSIAERERLTTAGFISKLHSEVLELHGEVVNFTSLLRCACLLQIKQEVEPPRGYGAEAWPEKKALVAS